MNLYKEKIVYESYPLHETMRNWEFCEGHGINLAAAATAVVSNPLIDVVVGLVMSVLLKHVQERHGCCRQLLPTA